MERQAGENNNAWSLTAGELQQQFLLGEAIPYSSPGNPGEDFMKTPNNRQRFTFLARDFVWTAIS
jgi:hypothetical protein